MMNAILRRAFHPLMFIFFAACSNPAQHDGSAEGVLEVVSPDQTMVYNLRFQDGYPTYTVACKGRQLIGASRLNMDFKNTGELGKNLSIRSYKTKQIDESYELVVGKTKLARNHCNELSVNFQEQVSPFRKFNLVIRVYNDGVAFRYEFPEQENWPSMVLTGENSLFSLAGDPGVLALFLPNYTTSHEGLYTAIPYSGITEDSLMDMPAAFDFDGVYMAITEAALSDYAGMYLVKHDGSLQSRLSPLPGQQEIRVKAALPHKSPWRVMLISDRIGGLFESNILTSLNEPCRIEDISWLRPGKATWPWWNGTIVEDPEVVQGNNFETNKYYIDFCARNGIEYHSVVEYGGHEWYFNDGEGYMPGPAADVTRPVDGLDMQRVCDYASSKGVGIRVWVHWEALYPKLEEAFSQYEEWGVSGLMIDFMDRDDQEMVNIQKEMVEKAAHHKLHVQFHGACKPTGMHRTWPNEFTREGTLNYEVDKWDRAVTPDHDLHIVFTRLLAGPTDYHLGGFRAVSESQFSVNYVKPLVMGTRCHMLAMYVVLESYLGLVCDYPEAYEGQPGFEFLRDVPTVWDEIKVLDAGWAEYIIMARRKNSEWYVGVLNNSRSRKVSVPFGFLPPGDFTAEIYSDSPSAKENPNLLQKEIRVVKQGDSMTLELASGGGAVMHLFQHQ